MKLCKDIESQGIILQKNISKARHLRKKYYLTFLSKKPNKNKVEKEDKKTIETIINNNNKNFHISADKAENLKSLHIQQCPTIYTLGLTNLRKQETILYDLAKFPILESLNETLGLERDFTKWERLHELWLDESRKNWSFLKEKKTILKNLTNVEKRKSFANCYDTFVLSVIAPHIQEIFLKYKSNEIVEGRSTVKSCQNDTKLPRKFCLLYQAIPCIRIQPPSKWAPIRPHFDAMYGHPQNSINFWLPLTKCSDTNSLQIETSPGAEDFAPIISQYGEVIRFWGNECIHYTVANKTDITRVSLDFRVVCVFDDDTQIDHTHKQTEIKNKSNILTFSAGGYYSKCEFNHESNKFEKIIAGKPSIMHGLPHRNKI